MTHSPPNPDAAPTPPPAEDGEGEFVWSFRGYHLRPSDFVAAMAHFFRSESQRANIWRQRLDTTTNWAVISTGASITVAFTSGNHHAVILLNALLITIYLIIEARRYRYYELWSSRIRLFETDFFAAMLVPPFGPSPDWAESLAESLLQPHFPITFWEAVGRRYRRNYQWIFFLLFLAWLTRLWLLPVPADSIQTMLVRAGIAGLPGIWVAALFLGYNLIWFCIGLATLTLQEASGEVLPRYSLAAENLLKSLSSQEAGRLKSWYRRGRRRQQLLAFIITDQEKEVASLLLKELKRGVTSLTGKGMYTGQTRAVLMCAITVTEVNHLKALVVQQDPKAFVIVTPAEEVLGLGFNPLAESE